MTNRKKRPPKPATTAPPASSPARPAEPAPPDAQDDLAAHLSDRLDDLAIGPNMEALTADEKEAFLARVRAQGRSLTSAEQYAIFGPPKEADARQNESLPIESVEEMEPAPLDATQLRQLQDNFFPELGGETPHWTPRLLQGIIFDFDYTLATPARPPDELLESGARAAEAYMRGTGMELPDDFWLNIVEARRFAQEKSIEEAEEHIADDAMSFLLQFFGYPASRLDPQVLRTAVDIFYAPEMTAWTLAADARAVLAQLQADGYKLALITNYNCDRAFQRTIDYLDLRRYFDIILTSAAVEYRKPDPKIFQLVLDHWDALPYEVAVVGDSLVDDIAGGLDIGSLTIQTTFAQAPQVAFDNQQVAETVQPDASADRLEAIYAYIHEWAQP